MYTEVARPDLRGSLISSAPTLASLGQYFLHSIVKHILSLVYLFKKSFVSFA